MILLIERSFWLALSQAKGAGDAPLTCCLLS